MPLRSGIVPERLLPQSQSSVMSVMVFSHSRDAARQLVTRQVQLYEARAAQVGYLARQC